MIGDEVRDPGLIAKPREIGGKRCGIKSERQAQRSGSASSAAASASCPRTCDATQFPFHPRHAIRRGVARKW
jgi:hypothetical protein